MRKNKKTESRIGDRRKWKILIFVGMLIGVTAFSLRIGEVLPTIGRLDTPANGQLSNYYIVHAVEDTNSPNLVTAVLADYRGFDTLFETCVLFLSGVVVIVTLTSEPQKILQKKQKHPGRVKGFGSVAFDSSIRIVVPILAVYAVYVLIHGEVSLGGGFQAGALLGCAYLLDRITPDTDMGLTRMKSSSMMITASAGVFLYLLTGILCMAGGGSFLEYDKLPLPLEGSELHSAGIFMIELGVTLCVAAVLAKILNVVLERTRFDD